MKAKIEWTSNKEKDEVKDFKSERDLLDYCFNKWDGEVIISRSLELNGYEKGETDIEYFIELYDDYRE